MPDKIKELYDLISDKGYFTDEKEFREFTNNAKSVDEVYDLVKDDGFFTDKNEFDSYFELSKKKSQDFPTLQDAFGVSLRGPQIPKSSRLISTSPSTGKPSPNLPSGAKQGKQTLTGEKTSIANKLNTYQATLGQVSQRYKANRQAAMKAEQMGDIEAAKEIYPLIEKDRQAIGTLTELIKNGREIARTQEPDTFLNNADIGFNTALGTLLQAPEGATAASAAIVKDVLDKLDVPKKEVLKRTIDFMSKDANVSHYIGEVGRLLTKSSEDRTETIKAGRDYNGSAWTALKKGDIGKAANYGFKDFANSLPSSMAYMSGIGAAAMSAGTVADELGGMEDRGEQVTALKTYGAIVKSALEVATERMLGAGKAGKELIQKLGKPAAEKAVKEATEALVKKSLGRKFAEQYGEEVLGEELNTIGSNAVDIYINGDKNKGLFDGIGDTFLQAMIGSTVQGGPATVINHRIDSKRIAEANAMKEQAVKLTEQAMEQPTEAAAQALEEKALELNKQAEDILTEERDMALNLSQETLDNLDMYDQQVEELLAAKEGVDAETAAIFDEKIEALEKEREQAVEVAKKEAKQNAKEEIKLAKEAEQDEADMLRAAKVEEGSVKEGENKYEYDPKAKDSSGDIGSSPNVGGKKESDITAGANKKQPSENVGLQTQEELVETPALKDVESTAKALEGGDELKSEKGFYFVGNNKLKGEKHKGLNFDELINRLATDFFGTYGVAKSKSTIESEIDALERLLMRPDNFKYEPKKSKPFQEQLELLKSYRDKGIKNVRDMLLSEAYHKAKHDGSNPELVKAVEELLTPKENAIQEQEASSVPIQPKAEGSQEVQGTQPESGPKEVADKGEKEVLIPKEFKPSVESKKAAKAFVELSNSEASAPIIKERKQAKIQEAIEEVRKADPAKADKMQEVFDRMPEIQQTLLEKGIIKAIDCKWG